MQGSRPPDQPAEDIFFLGRSDQFLDESINKNIFLQEEETQEENTRREQSKKNEEQKREKQQQKKHISIFYYFTFRPMQQQYPPQKKLHAKQSITIFFPFIIFIHNRKQNKSNSKTFQFSFPFQHDTLSLFLVRLCNYTSF